MSVSEFCNREVVIARADEPVMEAVRLMRTQHVGDIVVVRDEGGQRIPVGIVTDRDIVIEVMAAEVEPDTITLGDIMSPEIHCVAEGENLLDAMALMRDKGVRRMPVVNADGGLEGMLTVDDLLELVAEQLGYLVQLIGHEQARERRLRSKA
jgi:CBS domain-containing protein